MSTQPATATTTKSAIGLTGHQIITVATTDRARADKFWGETIGLEPYFEYGVHLGFVLGGDTVIYPKADWDQTPSANPNYRATLEVSDSRETERILTEKGVTIADPVQLYDDHFLIGSFLDSEGNKLWFCSKEG